MHGIFVLCGIKLSNIFMSKIKIYSPNYLQISWKNWIWYLLNVIVKFTMPMQIFIHKHKCENFKQKLFLFLVISTKICMFLPYPYSISRINVMQLGKCTHNLERKCPTRLFWKYEQFWHYLYFHVCFCRFSWMGEQWW